MLGFGAFTGGLFVTLFGSLFGNNYYAVIYLSLLAAMVGGAVFAMLHSLLCIGFKANQVISGVVINIVSLALTGFLTSQINSSVFDKPSDKFMLSVFPRITVPVLSEIPVDTAGIDVNKTRFLAVAVSGALSGLGGMCFAYSISGTFSASVYMWAGSLAIVALIFGNWNTMPTFAACLIFGFARSGAYELVKGLKLSSSFSDLAMTLPYILTLLLLIFFSKNNRAPRSLGEIYDKSKR